MPRALSMVVAAWSALLRLALLVLVFLVLPATTIALLTDRMGGDGGSVAALGNEARGRTPPRPLGPDATYVRTMVLSSGDLRVVHWIESDDLLLSLGLAVPAVAGAEDVEARNVRVVADGRRVTGPDLIAGYPQSYPLLGAHSVQVRYRLKGAVERSASPTGRGLVLVSALDVLQDPAPSHAIRSVLAPEVLSLACAPSTAPTTPAQCGTIDSGGGWSVEQAGERLDERVVAQVSLG